MLNSLPKSARVNRVESRESRARKRSWLLAPRSLPSARDGSAELAASLCVAQKIAEAAESQPRITQVSRIAIDDPCPSVRSVVHIGSERNLPIMRRAKLGPVLSCATVSSACTNGVCRELGRTELASFAIVSWDPYGRGKMQRQEHNPLSCAGRMWVAGKTRRAKTGKLPLTQIAAVGLIRHPRRRQWRAARGAFRRQ